MELEVSSAVESSNLSNIEMVSYFIFAWHMVLFVISIITQRPIYLVEFFHFGLDYGFLLTATRNFISGINPYQGGWYVKPPMSILINIPFAYLSNINAARVFFVINNICILFSLFLLTKVFALRGRDKVLFALATLGSSPFIMVTERGNLDGIMFLLVSFALYAKKNKYASGIWVGLASTIKVYPLIFIVPLLTSKKWKAALAAIVFIIVSVLLFPALNADFIRNQILYDSNSMHIAENISSIAPLWFFSMKLGFSGFLGICIGVLSILLIGLLCVYYDFALLKQCNNEEKTFLFASYVVFCINLPWLVYLYTGLLLFILLASSNLNELRVSRDYRKWLILSLAFVFFPAQSISVTLAISTNLHLIPQFGSAMLLLYAVMVRRNILNNIRGSLSTPVSFPNCPITE
jgi:uncharacterized membrane protein